MRLACTVNMFQHCFRMLVVLNTFPQYLVLQSSHRQKLQSKLVFLNSARILLSHKFSFSHPRDISMRCILFATVGSTLFNPMVRCDCTAFVLRCFDWTPLHVQLLSLPTDTPLSLRPGSFLTWLSLEQASRLCLVTSSSFWRCVHC